MSPLRNDEKRSLLQIARSAIESLLTHSQALQIPSPSGNLAIPSGAFVTLHRNGRLRGCMGRVIAVEPLADVVADCAVAAATSDPRFSRLHADELRELLIEVSVLSPPQQVSAEEVQPGTHGVIISRGENRGILLPQVAAERGWSRERFLEETCEKAGLPKDAWRDTATRIQVFTAEVFSDSDSQPQAAGDDRSRAKNDSYSSSQ